MTEDDIAPLAGPAFAAAFQETIAFARGSDMSNDPQPTYELVHLTSDYAARYGYLLGGLEMVAKGLATADAVLESYHRKYETQLATGCGAPYSASNSSVAGSPEA